MKTLKTLFMSLILGIPFWGLAQDEGGTYIDNLGVQDSSYMEQDLLAGAEQSSSSGNATIYIILAIIVIAVVAFVLLKKKKK